MTKTGATMPPHNIFFFAGLFFLFGVFLAGIHAGFFIIIFCFALFLLFFFISKIFKERKYRLLSFLSLCIILGGFYFGVFDLRDERIKNSISFGGEIEFFGTVSSNPSVNEGVQDFFVSVEEPFKSGITVKTRSLPQYNYGEKLVINGVIEKPFPSEYADYLEKDRIFGIVRYPEITLVSDGKESIRGYLFEFRNKISDSLKSVIPSEEAGFLSGLVLGERTGFSEDFKEAMKKSGTTHLVALSGYNITILVWVVLSLFAVFFRRKTAFFLTIPVIFGFVIMTGADASVVRAGIMGILALFAGEFGQKNDPRNIILFSALVMVLLNPKVLVFDVGFQLSFLALLGIIYISPVIKEKILFFGTSGFFSWKENLITTASAQLAVAPILIAQFSSFSFTSLVSNTIILEFIPITMGLGFLTAFFGFFSFHLSLMSGWIVLIFLKLEIFIIYLFGEIAIEFSPNLGIYGAIFYYSLILLLVLKMKKKHD